MIPRIIKGKLEKFCIYNSLAARFCSQQNVESINLKNDKFGEIKNFTKPSRKLLDGPNLRDFFKDEHLKYQELPESQVVPYLQEGNKFGEGRKVYFDVYGCQMNVNDTEIIWSILKADNYLKTDDLNEADVVLLVTCSIRDKAEAKIWNRIQYLKGIRNKRVHGRDGGRSRMRIGILGCMAERLKHKVLEVEKSVDIVAGPDSYRDLPRLLALSEDNQEAINVLLSADETYADVMPVRLNENSVTAYVSIMRGCDNMCTYCIVPFTRGRERSRPVNSIIQEVQQLSERGVKEITLLGQNVNSYRDVSEGDQHYANITPTNLVKGFKTVYKHKTGGLRFADLLDKVSSVNSELRIRFTSPHPKDFPDEVLEIIKCRPNICKSLHLPAQSGNSNVLERMRRGYTREAYLDLVDHVRETIPDVALSSDFICGFCGETEEEFCDTLTLMESVGYSTAYLFPYSMREKTTAHRRYQDDVLPDVKQTRLERMIELYRTLADRRNRLEIGRLQLVLVEGKSKRSSKHWQGRNDGNTKVIFPDGEIPAENEGGSCSVNRGDYVVVQINAANSQVLKGIPLYRSTLRSFYEKHAYMNEFTQEHLLGFT